MDDEPDLVVQLVCPAPEAEVAADRLWAAGATAVGLDGDDPVTLTASYPTNAAARTVAPEVGGTVVEVDGGWRDAWRLHARPVRVGGLVVVPAWQDVHVGTAVVLRIDSGNVFGSGTHPSTRLLLAALDHTPPLGLEVLDVGCGSGILSVTAARLGAASVTAVDIDPDALVVTVANAAANGVGDTVSVSDTPVEGLGRSSTWSWSTSRRRCMRRSALRCHAAPGPAGFSAWPGCCPGSGATWRTPTRPRRCWSGPCSTAGREWCCSAREQARRRPGRRSVTGPGTRAPDTWVVRAVPT